MILMTKMLLKKIVAGEYFYYVNDNDPVIYIKRNEFNKDKYKWELRVFKTGERKHFASFKKAKEYARALFKLAQLFGKR